MMENIVIKNLSKSFGDNTVLNSFSMTVKAGGVNCIMGRSGCGKTTLLNILLGLLEKDSGSIEGLPKSITCVFQEDRLCESFSPVTNIKIACHGTVNREVIEQQLSLVGLSDSLNRKVSELSGGMKRRTAIVRAMLANSELIIMDEPFKGLDEATRLLTADYIKKMLQGRTLLMVTHDEYEVELMGGTLIRMPDKTEEKADAGIQ